MQSLGAPVVLGERLGDAILVFKKGAAPAAAGAFDSFKSRAERLKRRMKPNLQVRLQDVSLVQGLDC